MKVTAITAATILAFAGTSAAIAAGDTHSRAAGQSSSVHNSAGVSGSAQMQSDPQTIRQVQQQLTKEGHQVPVDGKLGSQTQAALKKFQKQEGLQASGQLDRQTLAALGIDQSQSGSTGSSGSIDSSRSGGASGIGNESSRSGAGAASGSGSSSPSGSAGGMNSGSSGASGASGSSYGR